ALFLDFDIREVPGRPQVESQALHEVRTIWRSGGEPRHVRQRVWFNLVLDEVDASEDRPRAGIEYQVQVCFIRGQVQFDRAGDELRVQVSLVVRQRQGRPFLLFPGRLVEYAALSQRPVSSPLAKILLSLPFTAQFDVCLRHPNRRSWLDAQV